MDSIQNDEPKVKVLGKEREIAETIPEGGDEKTDGRNAELFKQGCFLRGVKGLTEEAIYEELSKINAERCVPPLPDVEVQQIAKQAAKYEVNEPEEQFVSVDMFCTDLSNAQRFVRRFGEYTRYCRDNRNWYVWDGRRWKADEQSVRNLGWECNSKMFDSLKGVPNTPDFNKLARHTRYSNDVKGITAMLSAASDMPALAVKLEDFDTKKEWFNVANGSVHLPSAQLFPHNQNDGHSKIVDIEYDEEANCDRWLQFLGEVFEGDDELIEYMQRVCGYILSGLTREHCMWIFYGSGRNGKGVFMRTLKKVLGDYAESTSSKVLLSANSEDSNSPSPSLAKLKGARFVETSETDAKKKLAEGLVKQITGGDAISCRFLNQNEFTYTPEFKIVLATNNKPTILGDDDGIWSRIKLVPFNVNFEKNGMLDRNLEDKLETELPGILTWCVEGARKYFNSGLKTCGAVEVYTQQYKEESNPVDKFIGDCINENDKNDIPAQMMYESYVGWCKDTGEYEVSCKDFNAKMKLKGFVQKRKTRGMVWIGLQFAETGRTYAEVE
jgi:putative DNA primase/helicase